MSFNWKSVLSVVGPTALNFIPGVGPVLSGVAKVASIIGGDAGQKIEAGLKTVTDGLSEAGKAPLSPDQQIELKKAKMGTEVALKEIGYKTKKLDYDDQAGGRDVIKTALMSADPLVRQARPKMMILLGKSSVSYTILTPILVVICAALKIDKELLDLIVKLILWQGATLWGAFTTSFTGYTVARSADKKIASMHELGADPSKILGILSKLGNKIS